MVTVPGVAGISGAQKVAATGGETGARVWFAGGRGGE